MIESFQFYINENLVKKVTPSKENATALMERAYARLEYIREQKVNKATAIFIFEDVYETLREASQALMEIKGYKPYSHEAHIAFLKEFYKFPKPLLASFDRFRILRNKCLYGAAQISVETCKEAMGFLASFLPELKKEFDKEMIK